MLSTALDSQDVSVNKLTGGLAGVRTIAEYLLVRKTPMFFGGSHFKYCIAIKA